MKKLLLLLPFTTFAINIPTDFLAGYNEGKKIEQDKLLSEIKNLQEILRIKRDIYTAKLPPVVIIKGKPYIPSTDTLNQLEYRNSVNRTGLIVKLLSYTEKEIAYIDYLIRFTLYRPTIVDIKKKQILVILPPDNKALDKAKTKLEQLFYKYDIKADIIYKVK